MALGSYDSPTFLGQKDKYLMGLSLPELLAALGIGFMWFLFSLMMPLSTIMRLVVIVPLTGVTVALLFMRVSGLMIPTYILLAISRAFNKPSFEETGELMLTGQIQWLESKQKRESGSKLGGLLGKKQKLMADTEVQQAELRAEMDKQVMEGAVAAEQMIRDGIRTMVKGR